MRNMSAFCLERVALYFKAMPISIDFYKGIFLHVIPVRIIVSWFYLKQQLAGLSQMSFTALCALNSHNTRNCSQVYVFYAISKNLTKKFEKTLEIMFVLME